MRKLGALVPAFPKRFHTCLHLILIAAYLLRRFIKGNFFMHSIIHRYALKIVDIFHNDISLCPVYASVTVAYHKHRSTQHRHGAVFIMQGDIFLPIHTGRKHTDGRFYPLHLCAKYHGRKMNRVHAKVQKRPACQCRLSQPLLALHIVTKVCTYHTDIPDNAAVQHLSYRFVHRHIPNPHCLGNQNPLFLRQL